MKCSMLALEAILLSCIYSALPLAQIKFPPSSQRTAAATSSHNNKGELRDDLLIRQNPIQSNSDSGFSFLGVWTWGPAWAVEFKGNIALVGQGRNYQVIDISDVYHPRTIYDTSLAQNEVRKLKIVDSTLFIVIGNSVIFCDSRQPFPLKEYGRYVDPNLVGFLDISISDSLMFLTTDLGVVAVNISDLQHPSFRGGIGVSPFRGHIPISSAGANIYIGPQGPGQALDIIRWEPDSVFGMVRKTLYETGTVNALYLRDTLLFVSGSRMLCFSIVDPWNPRLLDSISFFSGIDEITSKGNNLYCCTTDSGIVVLNIEDPSQLSIVGRAPRETDLIALQSAASDSALGVAEYSGVEFYSIDQVDSIREASFIPFPDGHNGIAKRGSVVYLASNEAGLWSVDFTDTQHPKAVSNTRTQNIAFDVVLTEDIACVLTPKYPWESSRSDSVVLVRLDSSGELSRLTSFAVDKNPTSIAVRDSLLFVGSDSTVGIFSISDPINPYRVGTWKQPGVDLSLSVSGTILAVGARVWDAGLRLLDISNPSLPIELSYTPMDPVGLLIDGPTAYIDTGYLAIFDVVDPSHPHSLGGTGSPCQCSSSKIVRSGKYLYLTGGSVRVIDVSNLANPVEIISFGLISSTGVAASYDTLFVSTANYGVWALQNNLIAAVKAKTPGIPDQIVLFDNYPNPFNPSTTIRYRLTGRSMVSIQIFDVLGRSVSTLVNEVKSAGNYDVRWEPSNMSSGVYFFRLIAGSRAITKKMLILR